MYKNKKLYNSLACLLEQFAYSHEFDDVKCCYQEVQDQVNYWFDVCEVKNNNLQVWGWAYIIGRDSKDVKFKLFLEGDTEDYIWGTEIRTRQDIQEKFGQQFDYKYSGVDVNVSIANVRKGTYKVWMLIHSTGVIYKVLIKENMKV